MSVNFGVKSVAQESRDRGGCRNGLVGLRVREPDDDSTVRIHGTLINKSGFLILIVNAESVPVARERQPSSSEHGRSLLAIGTERGGRFRPVEASRVVLVDPWPVACCPPIGRGRRP